MEIDSREEMIRLRNSKLQFFEDTHKYLVGEREFKSVTTFIHDFFPKFDAKTAILKMKKSGSFAKRFKNRTEESVIEEWDASGKSAAALGTQLHLCIEKTYRGEDVGNIDEIAKEFGQFKKFHENTHNIITPYAFEWRVYDEDIGIAGSIDAVFTKNNKFYIYDWKRVKEMKTDNQYETAFPPISHLDNCNFYQYALQLNMYKYILESKYDTFVEELILVIMHPNMRKYSLLKLPLLKEEIQTMLNYAPAISEPAEEEEEEPESLLLDFIEKK